MILVIRNLKTESGTNPQYVLCGDNKWRATPLFGGGPRSSTAKLYRSKAAARNKALDVGGYVVEVLDDCQIVRDVGPSNGRMIVFEFTPSTPGYETVNHRELSEFAI